MGTESWKLFGVQDDSGATVRSDTTNAARPNTRDAEVKAKLAAQMDETLKRTSDPRIYGDNPDIADTYPNVNPKNKMGEGNYPPPKTP